MERYAIYGAGSLGTVLGAYITKSGTKIDLINRNKSHVYNLNKNGAKITGTVEMTVPVKAITPDKMKGKYDVIFLMTKQLHNKEVVTFLKDYLSEEGVIVTMQNGLPEPEIAEIIGSNHTMGCVVEWGASLTAPGVCTLTSDPKSLSFHMGKMEGITKKQFKMVKKLLEKMCPVYTEDNLIGARWSKLLINSTFSGLGTVIGGTFGDVASNSLARKVAIRCIKECITVGAKAGVTFAPIQGKNIVKLFYYTNPVKRAIATSLIPIAMKKHKNIVPSMLQDYRNGKPCEIDAINGVVCKYGKKHKVKTPFNDKICEIIKKCERGRICPGLDNLEYFKEIM